jgi:Protein of unknown function (DUF4240)
MDEAEFWAIVQRAHDAAPFDMERKGEALLPEIKRLSKDEALAFADWFDAAMHQAYSWEVWAAAYIINGGCGDDTFSDFRASLVSRGRSAFERAVANPDSLAEENIDKALWFYEGYQYDVSDGVKAVASARPMRRLPDSPSGQKWEEEELPHLLPKLWARFNFAQ